MSSSTTERWLHQVLGPVSPLILLCRLSQSNHEQYAHRDFVFSDVTRTLSSFAALAPKTDTYSAAAHLYEDEAAYTRTVYDDGRTELLLCLNGTIPIGFKSSTYNIPVAFWLPYDYPKGPPIAYVVPTSTMLVRPSKVVEVSGRIGGEYLAAWSRKSEVPMTALLCSV